MFFTFAFTAICGIMTVQMKILRFVQKNMTKLQQERLQQWL